MKRVAVLTSDGDAPGMNAAIRAVTRSLARGNNGVLVGVVAGRFTTTPLADVAGNQKLLNPDLIRLADVLAP